MIIIYKFEIFYSYINSIIILNEILQLNNTIFDEKSKVILNISQL